MGGGGSGGRRADAQLHFGASPLVLMSVWAHEQGHPASSAGEQVREPRLALRPGASCRPGPCGLCRGCSGDGEGTATLPPLVRVSQVSRVPSRAFFVWRLPRPFPRCSSGAKAHLPAACRGLPACGPRKMLPGCCREANRPGRSCASVGPACAHVHSPPSPSRCTGPVATPASAPHPHAGQWSFLGGRRRLCRSPGRLSGRLHLGPPRRRDAGQSQGGGRWAGRPALRCFAALFSQYFPTRSTLFKVSVPVTCAPVSASDVPSVRLYHSVPTHPVRSTPDLTGPQEAPPPPALSKAGPGVLSPGVVLRRSPPSTVSVRVPHGDHAVVPWRGAWYGADAQTCVRPN